MNIVYATDNYWPRVSGIGVSIDAFKKGLEKMGHNVYIFAPNYPGAEEFDKNIDDNKVVRFASFSLFFSREDRLVYRFTKRKIFKTLDEIKPDLIHVQTEWSMGKYVLQYARKKKIPLAVTCHTNWEELVTYLPFVPNMFAKNVARWLFNSYVKGTDALIVPSIAMESVLKQYDINMPAEIIPTGIERDCFAGAQKIVEKENSSLYKKFPNLKDKKILMYAGRVGHEKNLHFLIDVLKKLVNNFDDVMLLIVGEGNAKEGLANDIKKKGLEKHVIFTGFIERDMLKNIYALSDIFVFPSKIESQGLVIVEAMLCGIPVVAIGEMGVKEVMKGDNGGYMVKDDVDHFVERTTLLLEDSEIYKIKSKEAVEYAETWNIDNKVKQMESVYHGIVK